MADGCEGFVGSIEMVRRTRGYRRWSEAVKARIVAESFQPGARVADVARRNDLAPHPLSDWRCQARQGLVALPAEAMAGVGGIAPPPFMPLSVDGDAAMALEAADGPEGIVGIELGCGLVVRVPDDVPVERHPAGRPQSDSGLERF